MISVRLRGPMQKQELCVLSDHQNNVALLNLLTSMQRHPGTIPTYWSSNGINPDLNLIKFKY